MLGELERGREHYGRRAWADAYRSLSAADQASRLEGEDLELLAMAAYLIGRDDDYLRGARTRPSRAPGRRRTPARHPFRILAGLPSFLSRRDGPRDRLDRPRPAVARARGARVRRARLSVVAGRGAAPCRRRPRGCVRDRGGGRRDRRALRRCGPDRLHPARSGPDSASNRGRSKRGSRCWTR